MTEQSHTPGPWTAIDNGYYCHVVSGEGTVVDACPSKFIAGGTIEHPSPREKANARLAAASPELLDELTEARTTLSILRTQIMVEIGRCADPTESRWEGVPEKLKERLDAIDAAIAKATGDSQ